MLKRQIFLILQSALLQLEIKDSPEVKIDIPRQNNLGDYSTNLAIVLAKKSDQNPRELAAKLVETLNNLDQQKICAKIELAGPGFINFFLSDQFLRDSLLEIEKQDEKWGYRTSDQGQKILLVYVSANPTGPLHVGHGRWAVVGDAISRLLKAAGHKVTTEFYVNNIGNQVEKLEASVLAARAGKDVPEGGYGGSYIKDVQGETREEMLDSILAGQEAILKSLGVEFDNWFMESGLHDKNEIEAAIGILKAKDLTFEKDGALWFKATQFGDDKDRVLVREDGRPTYFAADLAYHYDKFKRGFDHLINIWGTDHHGYVKRIKQAVGAMGFVQDKLEIIIGQLVALYRGKEVVRMSKRTGEMVTLEEVIEEIGSDATRFFFAMTDVNSHLNFDLELAKKKSNDNPVYYVQYAHARICSILNKASGSSPNPDTQNSELPHPAERALILKILALPDIIAEAAKYRLPHRLTEYARELATLFHSFYEQCKVMGNPSRIFLANCCRITLRNVLQFLAISTPEKM
ncbi:MAG: arginine--tRNA ligase [Candidatus Margulisbacteria bacterium]|nr:arginine--tRNA ligase [Candidatus Margulisiibacteriota bacterium]